jgi:phage baseplate assembly protein W
MGWLKNFFKRIVVEAITEVLEPRIRAIVQEEFVRLEPRIRAVVREEFENLEPRIRAIVRRSLSSVRAPHSGDCAGRDAGRF